MEENQHPTPVSPSVNPVVQPVIVSQSEAIAPTGPATLQPDPRLQTATINTSPTTQVGVASPIYPDPTKPLPPVEKQWTPSSQSPFSNPQLVLLLSLFGVVAVIFFLTFGISINIWIKVVLLLLLAAAGLITALRAYATDNNTAILLSIIISTIIVVGTTVVGTTYIYYSIKLKQVTNSAQNSYLNN
jgi:hypothetical protein